jgi:hypothetical protein
LAYCSPEKSIDPFQSACAAEKSKMAKASSAFFIVSPHRYLLLNSMVLANKARDRQGIARIEIIGVSGASKYSPST